MKLVYHEGKNFGDALNPIIFKHFLEDRLDQDEGEILLGIGSILGLKRASENTTKVHVFSSGYAANMSSTYGELPNKKEREKYNFICVRGPLTAKALELDSEKAVCDGAILITEIIPIQEDREVRYPYSFIPHVGSLNFYSKWGELLQKIGIHLIDPSDEVTKVIDEVQQSGVIFCEAMHGAIISDAYRVPWVPVVCYKTINEFKWKDYCTSLDMGYKPFHCPSLFSKKIVQEIFKNKFKVLPSFFSKSLGGFYYHIRNKSTEQAVIQFFEGLKEQEGQLSDVDLLNKKRGQLITLLKEI